MAVSTSSPNSPVVSAASPATSTSTISKMIAVKRNLKAGGKSFEEIFSALAADVTPPAGLSPLGVNATPMDTQTLLDEWLANDLQQTGLLAEVTDIPSLFSSPSLDGSPEPSYLGESPITQALLADFELTAPLFGSPLLGDLSPSLSPRSSLAGSPRLGYCHGSPDLGGLSLLGDINGVAISTPPSSKIKAETPTAALVAQLAAAGAFNIPWGTEPASQQLPLHPITPDQEAAAAAAAAAAAELRLQHAMGGGIAMPKVQASKRKTVDLDDIDTSDEAAVKRAKNTDAARRSRMKKLLKMEGLERRVSELEGDNNKLILKVAVLESEKASAEAREVEYERRIKRLEEQLSEAHSRLIEGRLPKD